MDTTNTPHLSLLAALVCTFACTTQNEGEAPPEADLSAEWAELPSAIAVDEQEALDAWILEAEADAETLPPWAGELSSPVAASTEALYCDQTNDCRSGCVCDGGSCEPPGFGPLPPAGYCDVPPERACSSAADCIAGCSCSAGVCKQFNGPLGIACHLPPPDDYEFDDNASAWSAYTGPQTHGFHRDGDVDWVAVYIGAPGLVRFRTHNLKNQADTRMRVYAFEGGAKGALLGYSDDIGGWYFWPDSKSSRIDLAVDSPSSYLIEISDDSPAFVYTDKHAFPEYTLSLSYL